MAQKSIRTPSYLKFEKGCFYFRTRLPSDLRRATGVNEVKLSLRSSCLRTARPRAVDVHHYYQRALRMVTRQLSELSREEFLQAIKKHMMRAFDDWDESRQKEPFAEPYTNAPDDVNEYERKKTQIRVEQRILKDTLEEVQDDLNTGDIGNVKEHAVRILQAEQIEAEPESMEFRLFCKELLAANVENLRKQLEVVSGRNVVTIQQATRPQANPVVIEEDTGKTLREVIESYLKVRSQKGYDPAGMRRYRDWLEWVAYILGDETPFKSIKPETVDHFIMALQKMPKNRTKKGLAKYTADELLAMDLSGYDKLSKTTMNAIIDRASSLAKFAIQRDWADKNFFSGRQFKFQIGEKKQKLPFQDYMLRAMARERRFNKKGANYWVWRIALLSAMRVEEISQLDVDDVVRIDGIWCFNVKNEVSDSDLLDQTVKNNSASRIVPLHNILLNELKFLDYVDRIRKSGCEKLFPDLRPRIVKDEKSDDPKAKLKYGERMSRMLTAFVQKNNWGEGYSFHSFRHAFIAKVDMARVDGLLKCFVIGHKPDTMGDPAYDHRRRETPLATLKAEVIDRLVIPMDLLLSDDRDIEVK